MPFVPKETAFVPVPLVKPVVVIMVLPAVKDVPVNVLPDTAPVAPSKVILFAPEPTVTLLLAVTESMVISFLVATVIFFLSVPSCVISMLSPLTRSTVSPPPTDVVSVVLEFVVRFHAEALLAAFLMACSSIVNVTSLPVALVVRYVGLPLLMPKLTSPEDKDLAVVVPVSPPREIVRATAVAESVIDCFVAVLRSKDT